MFTSRVSALVINPQTVSRAIEPSAGVNTQNTDPHPSDCSSISELASIGVTMVNPLMSSKQEPFSVSEVLGASASTAVKMELDHEEAGDEDGDKIEVKMEVLEEFFGLGFGGNITEAGESKEALIGSESLLVPLGPPPTYPEQAETRVASILQPAAAVKTVKVPLSAVVDTSGGAGHVSAHAHVFPPVLSIPCSTQPHTTFSLVSPVTPSAARSFSLGSPGSSLHIAVSPAAGPDTTTLTSPPPASAAASALSAGKKTIFTAKGLLLDVSRSQ